MHMCIYLCTHRLWHKRTHTYYTKTREQTQLNTDTDTYTRHLIRAKHRAMHENLDASEYELQKQKNRLTCSSFCCIACASMTARCEPHRENLTSPLLWGVHAHDQREGMHTISVEACT